MPKEYQKIQSITNQLAAQNDLGDRPISFSIIAGYHAGLLAKELKICASNGCYFYEKLNPFITYKGAHAYEINEAIRQANLSQSVEGRAWGNGTILISRSTFRVLEGRRHFLACLISHELHHFLANHIFDASFQANQQARGLDTEQRKLVTMEIRRASEVDAYNGSTMMLVNTGHAANTCLKSVEYSMVLSGHAPETTPTSTHPGFEEVTRKMQAFIDDLEANRRDVKPRKTNGKWRFNRHANFLSYIPQ